MNPDQFGDDFLVMDIGIPLGPAIRNSYPVHGMATPERRRDILGRVELGLGLRRCIGSIRVSRRCSMANHSAATFSSGSHDDVMTTGDRRWRKHLKDRPGNYSE